MSHSRVLLGGETLLALDAEFFQRLFATLEGFPGTRLGVGAVGPAPRREQVLPERVFRLFGRRGELRPRVDEEFTVLAGCDTGHAVTLLVEDFNLSDECQKLIDIVNTAALQIRRVL